MNNWKTIAPIHEYADKDGVLSQPFEFDETLSVGPIPEWVKEDNFIKHMSFYQREIIIKDSKISFIAQYSANSLGEPDTTWKGEHPISLPAGLFEVKTIEH